METTANRQTIARLDVEDVRAALQRPLPGPAAQITMAPSPRPFQPPPGVTPRRAGVLLLLYPVEGVLTLVLTVRTATLNHHGGQISLPGGGWEKGDRSLWETAQRETHEELGIATSELELLGALTPLYIPPSNNRIFPFVAHLPERPTFQPDLKEVAQLLEVDLAVLRDPDSQREEDWDWQGATLHVPFYALAPHKVWGATAIVLAEFLAALGSGATVMEK